MALPKPSPDLASAIRSGSPRANDDVYRLYAPGVRRYCVALLGGRDDADDCVQNTFLKVCNDMRGLDGLDALTSWIMTIARNEVYTVFRKRRNHLPLDDAADQIWDLETPQLRAERQELLDAVADSLEHLLPTYREVLILREMEQYSYAEIAAMTDSTISAVESRLFKARKALARRLAPLLHERSLS